MGWNLCVHDLFLMSIASIFKKGSTYINSETETAKLYWFMANTARHWCIHTCSWVRSNTFWLPLTHWTMNLSVYFWGSCFKEPTSTSWSLISADNSHNDNFCIQHCWNPTKSITELIFFLFLVISFVCRLIKWIITRFKRNWKHCQAVLKALWHTRKAALVQFLENCATFDYDSANTALLQPNQF